jgi:hypothetical protein
MTKNDKRITGWVDRRTCPVTYVTLAAKAARALAAPSLDCTAAHVIPRKRYSLPILKTGSSRSKAEQTSREDRRTRSTKRQGRCHCGDLTVAPSSPAPPLWPFPPRLDGALRARAPFTHAWQRASVFYSFSPHHAASRAAR